jgi:hypothetical protein
MRMIVRWGSFSIVLPLLLLLAAAPTTVHAQVPLAGTSCDPSCSASEVEDGSFADEVGVDGICGSIFNPVGGVSASGGYSAEVDGAFYVASASAGPYGANGVNATAEIWDYSFGTGGGPISSSADCSGNSNGEDMVGDPGDAVAATGAYYYSN